MLTPLEGAKVDVNPENGFLFVRYGGLVQACKLRAEEIEVLLAIKRCFETSEEHERSGRKGIAKRARGVAAGLR